MEYLYDGKYAIYLDGDLIYTSPATTKRPISIWFGNPVEAIIPNVSTWTSLEIDEIVIEELDSSGAKLVPVQAGRRQFP